MSTMRRACGILSYTGARQTGVEERFLRVELAPTRFPKSDAASAAVNRTCPMPTCGPVRALNRSAAAVTVVATSAPRRHYPP
jgi:hypothetical protein